MAKTKQQKKEIVEQLSTKLKEAKGTVFASYIGLKVSETEELKKKLRENKAEFTVAKKTLLKLALKDSGYEKVNVDEMDGGVAIVTGQDEVIPAKTVDEFAKKHELVQFFGGILEGSFIDKAKVKNLASLPSRDQLLARLVGSVKSPISGLVNVLAGNLRGLVNVLNAIKDSK